MDILVSWFVGKNVFVKILRNEEMICYVPVKFSNSSNTKKIMTVSFFTYILVRLGSVIIHLFIRVVLKHDKVVKNL